MGSIPGRSSGGGGPGRPGRGGAVAALGLRLGVTAAAGEEGKRGSGVQGFDSPSHLGLRRGEEAGRRERAAAALMVRGWGAGAEEARAVGLGCGAEERRRGVLL